VHARAGTKDQPLGARGGPRADAAAGQLPAEVDGRIVGFYSLVPSPSARELDNLWIEPALDQGTEGPLFLGVRPNDRVRRGLRAFDEAVGSECEGDVRIEYLGAVPDQQ
jgi:hypothetical protein